MTLDFSALKRAVSMADVLDACHIQLRPLGQDTATGPCPLHGGTNTTAFRVHLTRALWHCFSGCGGGNVLDLVARLDGTDVYHAALRLGELARLPTVWPAPASPETRMTPELPFRLQLVPHPYLHDTRKLIPETCAFFGVGYCRRGTLSDTIAIPIHDHDGRLVAYAGRRLPGNDHQGKYRFPRGFKKSEVLYNAWRLTRACRQVIVVEGFFDVFRVHQAGCHDVVALMGSSVSRAQVDWLLGFGRPVLLLLDGDGAGRRGTLSLAHALQERQHPYRTIELKEGVQPEDLDPAELSNLIGDTPGGSALFSLNQ